MEPSKQLLTAQDVAKILRLNPLTVYGYIRSGKLRAAKFGRYYRVSQADLQEFIARHTLEGSDE
jgi:excisionase family DNA binding protein